MYLHMQRTQAGPIRFFVARACQGKKLTRVGGKKIFFLITSRTEEQDCANTHSSQENDK